MLNEINLDEGSTVLYSVENQSTDANQNELKLKWNSPFEYNKIVSNLRL